MRCRGIDGVRRDAAQRWIRAVDRRPPLEEYRRRVDRRRGEERNRHLTRKAIVGRDAISDRRRRGPRAAEGRRGSTAGRRRRRAQQARGEPDAEGDLGDSAHRSRGRSRAIASTSAHASAQGLLRGRATQKATAIVDGTCVVWIHGSRRLPRAPLVLNRSTEEDVS